MYVFVCECVGVCVVRVCVLLLGVVGEWVCKPIVDIVVLCDGVALVYLCVVLYVCM